jgi:hypothetical protein
VLLNCVENFYLSLGDLSHAFRQHSGCHSGVDLDCLTELDRLDLHSFKLPSNKIGFKIKSAKNACVYCQTLSKKSFMTSAKGSDLANSLRADNILETPHNSFTFSLLEISSSSSFSPELKARDAHSSG